MICIVDCGSSSVKDIKLNLKKLEYNSEVIKMNDLKKTNLDNFSHIIISGRPTFLTQENIPELLNLFKFVKTTNTPILGICFGHQIIGLLYGSTIDIGKSIDKMENIQIVRENKLFDSIENLSLFQESHSEFISLPEDFSLLAKSESCQNEAMKHKDRIMYGTQFHPEVSNKEGQRLINNFLMMK